MTTTRSISQRLYDTVTIHGDRPALAINGMVRTYRDLFTDAARLVKVIRDTVGGTMPGDTDEAHGVRRGEIRVGILAERSHSAYVTVLGAALAGWTYVPLNPDHPNERICTILRLAQIDVIVVDSDQAPRLKQLVEQLPKGLVIVAPQSSSASILANDWQVDKRRDLCLITQEALQSPEGIEKGLVSGFPVQSEFMMQPGLPSKSGLPSQSRQSQPLYMMFTSGTTGEPKGICISRANVESYLASMDALFDFNQNDRFSQFFNLSFDLSVHDMFVCWCAGGCLYVPTRAELMDPVRFADKNRLSVWFSVPSLAALTMRFGRLSQDSLSSLRRVLFCGEALSWAVATAFQKAAPHARITNLYGPTEATIAITAFEIDADSAQCSIHSSTHSSTHSSERCSTHSSTATALGQQLEAEAVPIGHPFPGQEAIVVNQAMQPAEPGEIGELLLGGDQLAKGYYKNQEKSAEKFITLQINGKDTCLWYRTGDLALWNDQGGLIFKGRTDDQIKLHGHRIELTEVEEALRRSAGTALAIVAPWPYTNVGNAEQMVAFVCHPKRPLDELRRHMEQTLPRYMLPSKFIPIDRPFFNANHKLDRRKIVEQYGNLV